MRFLAAVLALSSLVSADQGKPWTGRVVGRSVDKFPYKLGPASDEGDRHYIAPIYPILPFNQSPRNPILTPNPKHEWESAYVYNPTAIVLDDTVFLLYRAQNPNLTSSIGLAWSKDGYQFTRLSKPIIAPTEPWEKDGGCEDPRIVRVNGTFYVTYTGYDRPNKAPKLVIAASEDLIHWRKEPPLFPKKDHSKSAAIVREPDAFGLYHMYWGDSELYHATSRDFKEWTLVDEPFFAEGVHDWESLLIEAGPAPIKTRDGRWILFYNGARRGKEETDVYYSVSQMLLDPFNITLPNVGPPNGVYGGSVAGTLPELRDGPVARLDRPPVFPSQKGEINGQVNNVTFCEGVVQFKGKWFMYLGQADTTVGVATASVQPKDWPPVDYGY